MPDPIGATSTQTTEIRVAPATPTGRSGARALTFCGVILVFERVRDLIPATAKPVSILETTLADCRSELLLLSGALGRTRTCNHRIRSPVLYPLSYGGENDLGPKLADTLC